MATMAKPKPQIPSRWRNTIAAAYDEGFVELSLTAFDGFTTPTFLPTSQHLQLLLYFATITPSKSQTPSPNSILEHWLDIHGAQLCPLLPRRDETRGGRDKRAPWLTWPAQNQLLLNAKHALLPCEREGIWALVWEKVDRPDEGNDSDEEEEEEVPRVPTPGGWDVLSFLASLWEAEAGSGTFESFMEQMGRPDTNLAYQSAGAIFHIVRAAFPPEGAPLSVETISRRRTAVRLLALLFRAAAANAFLPSSLVSSCVALLTKYDHPTPLASLLGALGPIDKPARTHILALTLEDLMGVRQKYEGYRKKSPVCASSQGLATPLAPPTVGHAIKLAVETSGDCADIIGFHLVSLLPEDAEMWKSADRDQMEYALEELASKADSPTSKALLDLIERRLGYSLRTK